MSTTRPSTQPGTKTVKKAVEKSTAQPTQKTEASPKVAVKKAEHTQPLGSPQGQAIEPIVLWVTGCKGGVGKTTTTRILTDLLMEDSATLQGYDCDPKNPQFRRFYNAEYLPLLHSNLHKADAALEALAAKIEAKQHQYIIIDSPAGEVDALGRLEKRFAFATNLELIGAKLTRIFILSTTPESTNLLKRSLDDTKGLPVGHVAVRNLHFGHSDYFSSYNQSTTKTQLESQGGVTINFPQLGAIAASSIDENSLTFLKAMHPEGGLPIMRRSMVMRWREAVRTEFAKAGQLLGVNHVG